MCWFTSKKCWMLEDVVFAPINWTPLVRGDLGVFLDVQEGYWPLTVVDLFFSRQQASRKTLSRAAIVYRGVGTVRVSCSEKCRKMVPNKKESASCQRMCGKVQQEDKEKVASICSQQGKWFTFFRFETLCGCKCFWLCKSWHLGVGKIKNWRTAKPRRCCSRYVAQHAALRDRLQVLTHVRRVWWNWSTEKPRVLDHCSNGSVPTAPLWLQEILEKFTPLNAEMKTTVDQ